jgi:cell division protein FtsZ
MTHLKEEAAVMMFEFAEENGRMDNKRLDNKRLDDERLDEERLADIKVIGVGGAGGNAVGRMIEAGLVGVEFFAVNTDVQALQDSTAHRTLQIGAVRTKGLGSGGNPSVGRAAADEDLVHLREALAGADMVFVTAGMGGGTGTGAAPVIARVARELGALTVGIVTKPFRFEASVRMQQALNGIEELRQSVDTLIIIPNQRLLEVVPPNTSMREAFRIADNVLYEATRGIYEIISRHDHVNLDFADVRTVMKDMGQAMMGTGRAEGPDRAVQAARAAISSPLLENVDIRGSRAVLVNVLGREVGLQDTAAAMEYIQEAAGPQAHVIFGYGNDESMGETLQLTVIATGFDAADAHVPVTAHAAAHLDAVEAIVPEPPVSTTAAATAAAHLDALAEVILPADVVSGDLSVTEEAEPAWATADAELTYVSDEELDDPTADLTADEAIAAAEAAEVAARAAAEREAIEREEQELLELEAQLRELEEEEARAAEEARLLAEAEEARVIAEAAAAAAAEEARLLAEAEAEEARLQALEVARQRAEDEARMRAEFEVQLRQELEARVREEMEARLREEHEARLREELRQRELEELEARELAEQEALLAAEQADLLAAEEEDLLDLEPDEPAAPAPLREAAAAAAATVEPWSLKQAVRLVQPMAGQIVSGFLSRETVAGGEPRTPAHVDARPHTDRPHTDRPAAATTPGANRFLTPVGTRSIGEVEVPDGASVPTPVTRSAAAGLGPDNPNADLSAPAYTRKYMD